MTNEENDWEAVYDDFDEGKVSMDYDTLTLSRSGREISLTLQISTQPDYTGAGALFWIDAGNVFLRYNWQTWYRVPKENLDILKDVAGRHAITLSLFKDNEFKSYPLRIFHVDSLPEHLFEEKDVPATEEDEPTTPDGPDAFNLFGDSNPDDDSDEQEDKATAGNFEYDFAVKNYRAFSWRFSELCHLSGDMPPTYDEFLQKASKAAWAKMLPPFKKELKRRKLDHFPHVKLNGGWADDAFSNEKTALLVQVYRGEDSLQRQITELTAVASDLQANEPDSKVMIGIVFDETLPTPSLPSSVERITREFLHDFTNLFPVEPADA